MWIELRGRSMWPLLWPGDQVQVERCDPAELHVGDVAVLSRPDGALIGHGVVSVRPLATASITGRRDAGLTPLARIRRVRRGTLELPVPTLAVRAASQLIPALAASPLRAWWRLALEAGTSAGTMPVRQALFRPRLLALGAGDAHELAITLSWWGSAPAAEIEQRLTRGRTFAMRLRTGGLGAVASVLDGAVEGAHVLRRLRGLGVEQALVTALMGPDVVRAEVDEDETGFREALTALGIPVAAPSRR
jgi:hypothetical protein